MTAVELRAFEREVADAFEAGRIRSPVHLAGGNEKQLLAIFDEIKREDWVFSTWRSHYHALLHGVPRELVMAEILAGRSINLHFPKYRFFTSALVGGILPIACGVAAAIRQQGVDNNQRVYCFIGDMAASIGAFHDAKRYASGFRLPITFVVERNGLSTNTPTSEAWGGIDWLDCVNGEDDVRIYHYERTCPHVGSGKYVPF